MAIISLRTALGAVILCICTYIIALTKSILQARKTGLVYIVTPVSPFFRPWQLTCGLWVPLIKLLPRRCWENWLFILLPEWGYRTGQEHFDRLGTDTFLVVYPGGMIFFTQSPEVIAKMTHSRDAFPKDIEKYGVLRMFGNNVLTTEGALWRMHRKVTSASFNEKNAAHTFREAINQTHGMLRHWFGSEGEKTSSTKTIRTLEHDTMRWALNIIGYVGFGLRLIWPGQELPSDLDPKLAKYGSLSPPPGHTLSFTDSLELTLKRIVSIMVLPTLALKILPFKWAREAYEGKINFLQYMNEFLHDKIEEAKRGGPQKEGMDIMGQLVQSKYGRNASPASESKDGVPNILNDSEIIGNAFIMIVAGHETTANTLHFALLELANNPGTQRRMQRDIDNLFNGADPSTWDYERSINALMASYTGAVVNETLRMMPPVTGIPKVVNPECDQRITINGREHVLPAGVSCALQIVCAQRNPRWWPTRPSERTGKPNDMDDFLPERWYRSRDELRGAKREGTVVDDVAVPEDKTDYGGFQGSDTSAALYRPVRGSYAPFSDGPRSCLGRRIAMVEMNAVLAVIFQKYSIELAVDDWASDEEVAKMSPAERRAVYARAQERSRQLLREADSVLTLKLHGGRHVPVRFVKRGCERFVADPELV